MVNNLIIGDWEVSRKNETDQNTYSSQTFYQGLAGTIEDNNMSSAVIE